MRGGQVPGHAGGGCCEKKTLALGRHAAVPTDDSKEDSHDHPCGHHR